MVHGKMTDARFLSNNSVSSEANCIKCEILVHDSWPTKAPNNCRNRSKGSPPRGDSLPKSGNFWHLRAAFPFPLTDWREISCGKADPRAPQPRQISHESVQRVAPAGENARCRPVSKTKYRQFTASWHPPGK